jgi:hypothetical protein
MPSWRAQSHYFFTVLYFLFPRVGGNSMPVKQLNIYCNSNIRTLNLTGKIKITADGTRCRSPRVWLSFLDVNSRRGKVVDIANSLQQENKKYTYCFHFTLPLVEDMEQFTRVFYFSKIHYGCMILMNIYRLRSVQTTQSCQKSRKSIIKVFKVSRGWTGTVFFHHRTFVNSAGSATYLT